MFRARPGNPDNIDFLKSVVANEGRRHLTGNDHKRYGIHISGGNSRDRIGGTGSGRGDRDTHLSRGSRIAVGGMNPCLFVSGQNVLYFRAGLELIKNIDYGAAGITEDRIHSLELETFQQNFSSCQFHPKHP
jgi:hypothetical protein